MSNRNVILMAGSLISNREKPATEREVIIMNSYEKLQENFSSYQSLDATEAQAERLMPLFDHILGGLEAHKSKLAQTAAQYAGAAYSPAWRKEEMERVAAENRETVKENPLLVLKNLKKSLDICGTAVATAVQHEVVATDIARNTQKLSDIEIRGDLKAMPEAERVKVLFETAAKGSNEILGALQRAPITQQLIPDDELKRATQSYLETAAPQQIADLELMESVVGKAKAAMSQIDFELSHIEQRAGVASKLNMKAY